MKNAPYLRRLLAIFLLPLLVSCATAERGSSSLEVTNDQYARFREERGIVLLAVNWGRHWKCGAYENAELMDLGFDLLPLRSSQITPTPAVFLDGPPRITKTPQYVNYALLLSPGEYALSRFKIKVAKSASEVGYFTGEQQQLIPDGNPRSGTFQVSAGESVYIGHFYLDCYSDPIPWRYYLKDKVGFNEFLASVKTAYPFLDLSNAKYRLFSTQTLGEAFELPN